MCFRVNLSLLKILKDYSENYILSEHFYSLASTNIKVSRMTMTKTYIKFYVKRYLFIFFFFFCLQNTIYDAKCKFLFTLIYTL